MRDQFNFSGDFRGAVVNIQSHLDQASQCATALPGDAGDRDQLTALLSVLGRELAKLPEREQAVAAQIASRTEELVATAAAPEPDRSRLRQLGDAVIGGVKLLGSAGPGVAETAEKVIALVSRIAG